jgi:hypothetical protein
MTVQSLKGKRLPILAAEIADTFWSRLDKSGGPTACWPWTGAVDLSNGYGQLNWKAIGGRRRTHVVAWEIANNQEVPKDEAGRKLDVDHLCHNRDTSCAGGKTCKHRLCCNPLHLEPKTTGLNKDSADYPRKRGIFREQCRFGHAFTEENTIWTRHLGPRKGETRLRPPDKRCRVCEYTKMCKQPECTNERHDHEGTLWPKGNYALILAARVTGKMT